MDSSETHSSRMRVAIVSASRAQRETLKSLIEDNGQQVIGTAGFRDYFLREEQLHPDVLLVDLDKADDDALDRLDRLVEQSKVPILFNESPTVPTTPGPYRDEWANNLIGKLHDLAKRERDKNEPGLLDRPRYETRGAHAFPKVLVVSRSKTRRRVIQLVLMNQGFREVDEIAYAPDLVEKHIASYGAVVADEHSIGPEAESTFNTLISQTETPVQICNSSTVPAVPSARKVWGSQLAAKLVHLSKRKQLRMPMAIVKAKEPAIATPVPARDGESERITRNLAPTPSNTRETTTPAREIRDQPAPARAEPAPKSRALSPSTTIPTARPLADSMPKAKPTPRPATLPNEEERKKKALIVDQVDTGSAESKRESARLVKFVAKETRKDLKYLPPERAAALRSEPAPAGAAQRAEPDVIDATNFETLPTLTPPGQAYQPSETLLASEVYADEFERFSKFDEANATPTHDETGAKIDAAKSVKAVPVKTKNGLREFDWSEQVDKVNPFEKKNAKASFFGKKIFSGGNPTVAVKAFKPSKPKKRSLLMNSLGGIKQLLPKIFN